jgi:hypothetical protein
LWIRSHTFTQLIMLVTLIYLCVWVDSFHLMLSQVWYMSWTKFLEWLFIKYHMMLVRHCFWYYILCCTSQGESYFSICISVWIWLFWMYLFPLSLLTKMGSILRKLVNVLTNMLKWILVHVWCSYHELVYSNVDLLCSFWCIYYEWWYG